MNAIQYSIRKIIKVLIELSNFTLEDFFNSIGIALTNSSKLASMAYMKQSRYSTCKGEDLYCSSRIINRMSTYKQEFIFSVYFQVNSNSYFVKPIMPANDLELCSLYNSTGTFCFLFILIIQIKKRTTKQVQFSI